MGDKEQEEQERRKSKEEVVEEDTEEDRKRKPKNSTVIWSRKRRKLEHHHELDFKARTEITKLNTEAGKMTPKRRRNEENEEDDLTQVSTAKKSRRQPHIENVQTHSQNKTAKASICQEKHPLEDIKTRKSNSKTKGAKNLIMFFETINNHHKQSQSSAKKEGNLKKKIRIFLTFNLPYSNQLLQMWPTLLNNLNLS